MGEGEEWGWRKTERKGGSGGRKRERKRMTARSGEGKKEQVKTRWDAREERDSLRNLSDGQYAVRALVIKY